MARVELVMPKMGESIMEATILKWRKKIGESVELDEAVLDIATDKVDSEVPSPVAGVLVEILFQENDVVAINKAIAILETDASAAGSASSLAIQQHGTAGRGALRTSSDCPNVKCAAVRG
jgi:2-oxoglutarate dehydrogenase E2 component (dihydrolipoamide succinyltransferase)